MFWTGIPAILVRAGAVRGRRMSVGTKLYRSRRRICVNVSAKSIVSRAIPVSSGSCLMDFGSFLSLWRLGGLDLNARR